MAEVLVVYYSRSGTTAAAARHLAAHLQADVDEVLPIRPYTGVAGFLRCILEAAWRNRPDIAMDRNPASYRLVILGSPVWAGRLASPMRSWLSAHLHHLPPTSAFCTSGSGLAEAVFMQIRHILKGRPLRSTLSLSKNAVLSGAASADIERWAGELKTAPEAARLAT